MSSSDSKNSRKDFVWKYVIEVAGEQYLRCKFCNQRCTGGVNRLKHHLAGTHHGMKPCNKVSEDARLECKEALANFKDKKTKKINCSKKLVWVQLQCMRVPCLKQYGH